MRICEAMTSSTHSFPYSLLTVQEVFRWKLRKLKILYLPYFLSDLHQLFTVLFENFYSLYGLHLNLDRISPLSYVQTIRGVQYANYLHAAWRIVQHLVISLCTSLWELNVQWLAYHCTEYTYHCTVVICHNKLALLIMCISAILSRTKSIVNEMRYTLTRTGYNYLARRTTKLIELGSTPITMLFHYLRQKPISWTEASFTQLLGSGTVSQWPCW